MRTRETIEAQASGKTPTRNAAEKPSQNPNSLKNLIAPWTSETAPRNGGRPKKDMAADISKAIFENNPELIYKAYSRALAKGQAFAFQVLADRAYGKMKETIEHVDAEVSDSGLEERVAQLERELYPAVFPTVAREADEAARAASPESGTEKANGEAKDSKLLPR